MSISKFMENMEKKLISEGLKPVTVEIYIKRLMKLNGGKFNNLKFIRDVDVIMNKMNDLQSNTKESYTGMIISVLKKYPIKANDKARKEYEDIMKDPSKYFDRKERGVKTEAQEKNWLSKERMDEYIAEAENKGKKSSRKRVNITTNDYNDVMDWTIVSLYTKMPPRRNKDYSEMKINSDTGNSYDTDTNELVFRNYKTEGKFGEQRFSLSKYPEMNKVMKIWMNKRSNNEEGYLLSSHDGSYSFKSSNSMTRRLNKIFGGHKVSSTALRSMYLSDKYKDTNLDMKEDAEFMSHTVGIQQTVYVK